MNGIVQSVMTKESQYGKFSEVTIDSRQISAFKEHHQVAVTLSAGDSVEYSFEMKGKYPRFTQLVKTTAGAAAQATSHQPSRPTEFITRDESVLVSYAKDMLVANKDMAPSQAVDAIMELVAMTKKGMKENPTS